MERRGVETAFVLFLIRLIRDIRGRNPVWERWFIPFADLTPWLAFEDDITASGPAYEQARTIPT